MPAENAARVIAVLDGSDKGGARSAVLLNAAAAIYVSGDRGRALRDGLRAAAVAIDSRRRRSAPLTALREASVGG